MSKSDLRIKVSAEISGIKLTEDCQLDDNISNMVLDKMRKENLSFKNAVESFFGFFQHDENGVVIKREKQVGKPIYKKTMNSWTQNEIETLILNAHRGYEECSKLFPNRTYESIGAKGRKLGLSLGIHQKNKKWSEKEVCILIDYYGKLTIKQLAIILGRSENAIHNKLYDLRH